MNLVRRLVFKVNNRREELEFDVDHKNNKIIIDSSAFWKLMDKITAYSYEYEIRCE